MPGLHADKKEVLRYLGYHGQALEPELEQLINQMISLAERLARPRWTSRCFALTKSNNVLYAPGCGLAFSGKDITALLQQATSCVIMAATIGAEVEQQLRSLQKSNLTAALVFDAACDALAEAAAETCHQQANAAAPPGLVAGERFSPGYGDLPLNLQAGLVSALDAERQIGLTVTENSLLIPKKSITAICGLYQPENCPLPRSHKCQGCSLYPHCTYAQGGQDCD